ncbi:SDR family NAD(P)-dependent oxidoreductase [Cellulomonas shaoxiangyii]|uniref:SDR family oxidoreductase n=1 Tax=Cellulomonas shaoxiangyii TaxID=2566013 RepID=A0A4P7SIY3_9CELL|nr:SDR family NAD(P)-dependent oxidoreductase [Cellulomonas shaoxiangyii]QCB94020.1 SDR family oxidoreductase [Cellulomonas shaoxiangyii]TGY85791.1 SDR family oxidoreductase [Cellulomonas shaoxiangyii]
MLNFEGRRVIVTGAGAGIGRETALLLARHGAAVVVNALEGAAHGGQETVDEIVAAGGRALFVPGDVSDPEACRTVVETTVGELGGLDVLVNNAGVVLPGTVETTSDEALDTMLAVNVKGVFSMSRAAVPAMRQNGGGVIVNTGSVAAIKGHTDRAAYAATKGAVVALTRSMAADHIGENIRVNCVCPGTTMTPAIEQKIASAPDPAAAEQAFVGRQPIGRLGYPSEIAHAIAFAASPEVGYMTGSVLVIDGGMTM